MDAKQHAGVDVIVALCQWRLAGVSYHDLASFQFIGNELIKLYFFHATVVIQGSNLGELADLIQRHQVMTIREQNEFTVQPGSPCVRKIGIIEPNLAALARKPAGSARNVLGARHGLYA